MTMYWGLQMPTVAEMLHTESDSAVVNSMTDDKVSEGMSDTHTPGRRQHCNFNQSLSLLHSFFPLIGESGIFGFVMMMMMMETALDVASGSAKSQRT